MDVPARNVDTDADAEPEQPTAIVSCHETRPGKIVFTERDNTDGWIATDLTVDLDP
ncbi:hypothetical protein C500_12760 [Natrialba magadii ATCC 43099]|uniref:Uncharacterized protein n=1 Tax=Natrialba magadii (strain ATCC 43099 / DSM 3394 / CCM 3739 / CIP 104546 / IAM 13178 / JCM 8861 / NBRC 102185 / NCIMB 2190 / MS3) TaxID=547559 RepID=L9UVN5_NATMM|nr:hypothetical protein [Natrialba magadii]ELY28816.1 hypothetical protein C500_12760 [Natrialba magadii ATCC 43099]